MARRRIAPLIAALLLGTALLVARLYQVQVVEARTWTAQAATLVRSGTVRPYERGALLDARGRPLALPEDESERRAAVARWAKAWATLADA